MSQNNPEITYDPMCECGHRESAHDHTWSDLCMQASCECPSFKHRIINGDQDEDDLNPLEAKADAILQYRQDHIGWDNKEPEQLSEAACKFVEWVLSDWVRYNNIIMLWNRHEKIWEGAQYEHKATKQTTQQLFEYFLNNVYNKNQTV